jgi:membrane associated rhomboid family serine protease
MLLIINVVLFFASSAMLGGSVVASNFLAFHPIGSENFRPFQIVSHMFMHGNVPHLFFNMFGLYMFGPPLEMVWGPKKFLFYYLFTGFGALLLHLVVMSLMGEAPPVVGASGAIFGLLAGFGVMYPETRIMLLFPPIPMKAKYFVLIYGAIELFFGFSNYNTGIAHFAHVGGAVFGFLLIQYWYKFGSRF